MGCSRLTSLDAAIFARRYTSGRTHRERLFGLQLMIQTHLSDVCDYRINRNLLTWWATRRDLSEQLGRFIGSLTPRERAIVERMRGELK